MLSQSFFLLEKDAYISLLFRAAGVGESFYHLDTQQQFSYSSSYNFIPKVPQISLFFFLSFSFTSAKSTGEQRQSTLKLSLPVQCCCSVMHSLSGNVERVRRKNHFRKAFWSRFQSPEHSRFCLNTIVHTTKHLKPFTSSFKVF